MKSSLFGKYCTLLAMVTVFLLGANPAEPAEDMASFYQGKVVRLVVASSPGGSTDINARLLAPALERYLKCTVVVVNKAGAGGMVGTNDFYNSSPKDGLTLMISMEGLPLAQALGAAGVRFDCRKFGWIAGLYKDSRSLQVAVGSPYKTLDDLRKLKQAKAAVSSVTSPAGPQVILAIEALNLENAKLVKGYPGSTEIKLALMRMEADFTVQSKSHIMRKDSFMRPLITVEEERDPDFPDLPTITEMKIKPETMRMMELIMKGNASGRALITPPGVPNEKIAFLRKVTAAALKDADYVASVKKADLFSNPISGEKTAESVEKALNASPEELEKLRFLILKKY